MIMKEEEIRKRDVFNRYLELVADDVKDFFNKEKFLETACPACGSAELDFEFEKIGFKYVSCKECRTLFVNPRPSLEVMKKFYSESASTSFWVNEFFKPVAEARREKIFRPRAEYLAGLLENNKNMMVAEIGAGFGIFLEEMRKISPGNRYIAIEPSREMSDICLRKGLETKMAMFEEIGDMDGRVDLLISFELLEHLVRPEEFFKKACAFLKPGGKLVFTTLNGMGFDILLLWESSKSVAPPHHLNFFNPYSIKLLIERFGFEPQDISTPGKLDWDIVEGMIKNEGVKLGRFWQKIANDTNQECKAGLQQWITKNNLSSHMRVLARRDNADIVK